MYKTEVYSDELQTIARFARVLSHPARLAILQYVASCKSCISGNIADHLPLSPSTVSQHLSELKQLGLIKGSIDGVRINYCLNTDEISRYADILEKFLSRLQTNVTCE